jgi:alanyl-tRNA synthetase
MTLQTLLLYQQSDDLETEASVLEIDTVDSESIQVILDRTIFHPQGGGQPSDTGVLSTENGQLQVKMVKFNGSQVAHICSKPSFEVKVGSMVFLKVNAQDRLFNSALHTAGHLIFSIIRSSTDLVEKKGHHFPSGSYVEFTGIWNGDADEFSKNITRTIEDDLKVSHFLKDGKRFVQIQGFPECACGGTHLQSLGQLENIEIKKIKVTKGITRISYMVKLK